MTDSELFEVRTPIVEFPHYKILSGKCVSETAAWDNAVSRITIPVVGCTVG